MMKSKTAFDVVIAGAGPAGVAAGISILGRGQSVLILESAPAPRWKIGETLASAARPILSRLGLLSDCESSFHLRSYGNVCAWGSTELYATDFIFNPHGHGWHLDRAVFERQLTEAARRAGACIWYGAKLSGIDRMPASMSRIRIVRSGTLHSMCTHYLIDATGRHSTVAHQFGVRRKHIDALTCIYMLVEPNARLATDRDTRTLVESTAGGWWYSTLVPAGRRIIALLTDSSLLKSNAWRSCNWFQSQLSQTHHLRTLVLKHGYRITGRPHCTSANSSRLETFYGDGWLAIGDAAMAFDPLSSQGLFHALLTGAEGGLAVSKCLEADARVIQEYAAHLHASWNKYLENRNYYYQLEGRWDDQAFWKSRCDIHQPLGSTHVGALSFE